MTHEKVEWKTFHFNIWLRSIYIILKSPFESIFILSTYVLIGTTQSPIYLLTPPFSFSSPLSLSEALWPALCCYFLSLHILRVSWGMGFQISSRSDWMYAIFIFINERSCDIRLESIINLLTFYSAKKSSTRTTFVSEGQYEQLSQVKQ